MDLPVKYADLDWRKGEVRAVREEYIRRQNGLCSHCNAPLDGEPAQEIMEADINLKLFPPNFFNSPVHLHHSHDTGLTLGAVHNRCNAVLWQYFGE